MPNKLILSLLFAITTGCMAEEGSTEPVDLTVTDTDATLVHDGTSTVVARADASGSWRLVLPQEAASTHVLELLQVEQDRSHAEGAVLPWEDSNKSSSYSCWTHRTWTFGGSCSRCYGALQIPPGTGESWECDSGSVYTTCSIARCG